MSSTSHSTPPKNHVQAAVETILGELEEHDHLQVDDTRRSNLAKDATEKAHDRVAGAYDSVTDEDAVSAIYDVTLLAAADDLDLDEVSRVNEADEALPMPGDPRLNIPTASPASAEMSDDDEAETETRANMAGMPTGPSVDLAAAATEEDDHLDDTVPCGGALTTHTPIDEDADLGHPSQRGVLTGDRTNNGEPSDRARHRAERAFNNARVNNHSADDGGVYVDIAPRTHVRPGDGLTVPDRGVNPNFLVPADDVSNTNPPVVAIVAEERDYSSRYQKAPVKVRRPEN
jgi:hypothetical protein